MRRALAALILAGTTVTAPLRAAEPENVDPHRRALEQQRKQQQTYIERLELLPGKRKIEDVVRVTTDEGKLVIKSSLFDAANVPQRNRQVRAEVEGFEGFCTMMVQPVGKGSFYFTFSNVQYPNLEGVQSFSVSTQPGYLQISRNYNSRNRNQNVSLVQTQGRAMYGQVDGVQLNVYSSDGTGRMNTSLNVSEPDFATLRRKHPREVNEHLRPLLRDLRLETLFAVDPVTAWQVFAPDWRGNATVAKQVKGLLPALDADAYRDREAARAALRKLGAEAALVIYGMDRSGLSPEQSLQLDAMVASHSFLSRPDAEQMSSDVDFLLDCLYSDDRDVRDVASKRFREVTRREAPLELADAYDVRATQVEALRKEFSRATTKPSR